MPSPLVRNTFTQVPNTLLESMVKAKKLNGTQYSILLALIRKTYGFHIESAEVGIAFFCKVAGRNKRQIAKEIRELIDMNVLIVESQHTFGKSRALKLNEDCETWHFERKGMVQKQHRGMVQKQHRGMVQITHLPMVQMTH